MLRELMAVHQWTCDELNQEMSETSISIHQPDQFSNVWHFARHGDIQRRAKEWAAGAISRPPVRNVPINKTHSILAHEGSLDEIVYSIKGSVPTKSIRPRSVLRSWPLRDLMILIAQAHGEAAEAISRDSDAQKCSRSVKLAACL